VTEDIRNNPQYVEWEERVRTKLIPKIEGSALTVTIAPSKGPDIKFSVELGLSIMLDKKIIVVCTPGQVLPGKLRAIADEVVEVDWRGGDAVRTQEAIREAISKVLGEGVESVERNAQ
jgi:hypothetical protein